MRRALWGFVSVLLMPTWVLAATYYVRTGGDNGHSCGQAQTDNDANAKSSIQAGVNCVTGPGDTVIVHGGTYGSFGTVTRISEGASISGSDLGSAAITLRNASGETVQLLGQLDMWEGQAEFWIIDGINVDGGWVARNALLVNGNCRIQNLEVKNSLYYGIGLGGAGHLINVRSHGHGRGPTRCAGEAGGADGQCHGVYFDSDHPITIENSEMYDLNGHCFTSTYTTIPSPGPVVIRNNKCYDSDSGGQMLGLAGPIYYYNNLVYNNRRLAWIDGTANGNQIYNNTFYNNDSAFLSQNNSLIVRNNIFMNNSEGFDTPGSSATYGTNLCSGGAGGSHCNSSGNPGFINAAGGNFHILTAGSAAVGIGTNLSSIFTTDADHLQRPPTGAWTVGAYEFGGVVEPPPGPLGLVQWIKCNGNVLDSSPNGFNGTISGAVATNGATIVAGASCVFTPVNAAILSPNNAVFRPPNFGMAVWLNTTAVPTEYCHLMKIGTTAVLGYGSNGLLFGFINNGPTVGGVSTLVTGFNELVGLSYDGTNLRLWRGASGSGPPLVVGQPLSYGGSEVLSLGSTTDACPVRAQYFRFFDQAFTATDWQNIVNEVVPSGGVSTSHMRYYADAAEGSPLRPVDTDLTALPGLIVGMRFGIQNTAAQMTEYFPLWCSRSGVSPAIGPVKVTNNFDLLGLRIANSVFVNMGQATTVPIPSPNGLPLDTFTPTPGQFVADTINTSFQKTLGPGQHREDEYRIETGSPSVGGDTFVCHPRRESDAPFNVYNNLKTLTLQAIAAPSAMRLGGVSAGGIQQ